ncbi:3-hydroxyacyl-[acyl-carrier-protein] dehydratase [Methylacidimicrobium cyclopophantes]|uniref:3-hydroxyacyl-[acyl-carrier-protein] dehydratase n=1 Tax=Methylacidimicrobium cyclopophantes TaxID=1041766 RepID=A0A5E6MI42_9BACT|nr:3-hydroxyacyl-ACP dehydratase [Methylacidimicrobium cyclopophantes]VVM07579.1 3-hydroxyacyl-[acyl-carrier-protein] dehydratase [Methylacidimicrobium cyclopophantes]
MGEPGPARAAPVREATERVFSRDQIEKLLPQKPPFLFLDEAVVEARRVRASYLLRGAEDFFRGHFPGNPTTPAAIVFEALGQAGCLWLRAAGTKETPGEILFAASDGARFFRKTGPGDRLELEMLVTGTLGKVATFSGKVFVQGREVARVKRLTLITLERSPGTEEKS